MTDTERELASSIALDTETAPRSTRRSLLGAIAGIPPWVGAIVGILVIIAVWYWVSYQFFPRTQSVPPPHLVFIEFFQNLGDPVFWRAIADTGAAAAWGYLWGNLIAFVLAFLVLVVPLLDGLVTQLAVICSCIPLTAIAPVVTLLAPVHSRLTAVFLAALSVIFTSVVGALLGLRTASPAQVDVIRAYGGGTFTELVKVRFIAAVPSLLAALKLAAPAAFLGSVLGEYFLNGVDTGLGIMLLAAQSKASPIPLWSLALICGGVAGLAYWIIGLIGRAVTPWASGERG